MSMQKNLRITEIFYSLQGESVTTGLPTVFIRLTGCPLRCQYCDSAYAFQGGQLQTIESILQRVSEFNPKYITVTGGEPLAQPQCLDLLTVLCDQGYVVSIETSGAMDISKIDKRVVKVMDLKTPGSLEEKRNLWENLSFLSPQDQIKIVICDRQDYDWAKQKMKEYDLAERCQVLLSPSYQQMSNQALADWIIADNLPVRFQMQLHKVIWGDIPGK